MQFLFVFLFPTRTVRTALFIDYLELRLILKYLEYTDSPLERLISRSMFRLRYCNF